MTHKPVSLITGVGDGAGASLARRFAKGGYQVAMVARDQKRLNALQKEIPDSRAYACDISDLAALTDVVDRIHAEMGQPNILVHNAVSATCKTFLEADSEELERNFRINTTTLYELARMLAPAMIDHGTGAIMVTGNSAAHRGAPDQAAFAPTKAAQRILAQSLARQLGPKGIHVAYVTIDASIKAPWTDDVITHDKPDDFFSNPADIADEVFRVSLQPPSAWSFDVEIRPYGEHW